ncbi:hypothetical protein DCCM_3966 [Desulfocucumis palustris]|uniref:Uncharacterized protein n=1 Tax=Desulfocucumis palustris TaxID=1898651 RepID=A0A2L2XKN5_9FIRM|nr:hypothetical protein [Desulfocucumis palustris]GBF34846.1 hypothetical protein DCCM_3966 [Desulfocucumis palustris]
MKKSIYVLTLLILFLGISGCNVPLAGDTKSIYSASGVEESNIESPTPPTVLEPTDTPDPMPGLHTYEIQARLHESMPEYRFVATGVVQGPDEWMYGFVMGLNVYDENGESILSADFSEISDGKVVGYHVYNGMMDTMGLHVTDVNFDGYKDVIILNTFGGAHSNTWYDCWLWDTKTSSFVASKSFAEICNPALDAEKKCIYSAGGSGAAYWGGRIYKFIDGEYVVTNELDTDWNGLVERELINGKMEIVREVSYGEDNQILEREQEYYRNSELWQLDHPHWYWLGGHHADQWLDGV